MGFTPAINALDDAMLHRNERAATISR